jgi:hypothetical protein
MKQTFIKYHGRVTENLELRIEDKWIYVHYTKGAIEKTACILINEEKSKQELLEGFFKENGVNEAIKKEVDKYLMKEQNTSNRNWIEFTNYLLRALPIHLVVGIAIALCVLAGYKMGTTLDVRYSFYPVFTLLGTFLGIGIGGLTGFTMIQKYVKSTEENKKEKEFPRHTSKNDQQEVKQHPVIDLTIDQVRKAIREFSDNLPKGVYRTILVQEDNSIDFKQLAHILKGVPSKKFYMSKETYDLFEENEKKIPVEMDMVQKAVDQYVKEHKEYPMLNFDPHRRVNYYQLIHSHYLSAHPEVQFYITDLDGLVTHIKPRKKLGNSS